MQGYFERFDAASEAARNVARFQTLRYGTGTRETVDVFGTGSDGAPLLVWIHGGYWRRMSKDAFSFVAPPLVDAGAAVAVINYPLAPAATLDQIVASVRRAFAFVVAYLPHEAPRRVVVGGHSVGAQLAAMVAASAAVDGLFALSGLYDLEPLLSTKINDTIAMDLETALRYAPLRVPPLQSAVLAIACGEREQAEFHRQQRDYVAAWRAWGGAVRELGAPGHDHFSIVLELADARTPIACALRELVFESAL